MWMLRWHLQSLLYRAGLLKWRQLGQTIMEICLLGVFALMASAIGYFFAPKSYDATNATEIFRHGFNWPEDVWSNGTNADSFGTNDMKNAAAKIKDEIPQMGDLKMIPKLNFTVAPPAYHEAMMTGFNALSHSLPSAGRSWIDSVKKQIIASEDEQEVVERLRRHEVLFGIYFQSAYNYTILGEAILLPPMDDPFVESRSQCYKPNTKCDRSAAEDNNRGCYAALHCTVGYMQMIINYVLMSCQHDGRGHLLDSCRTALRSGASPPQPLNISFNIFPKPQLRLDEGRGVMFITLIMVMSTTPFVNFVMVNVVSEKENRIKDGFRMMGMTSMAYGLSWFIVYSLEVLVGCFISCAIFYMPPLKLFRCTKTLPTFLIAYFSYAESILLVALLVAPFFNKAILAGIVGSLANALFALLYLFLASHSSAKSARLALSIFSPCAFAQVFEMILRGERIHNCTLCGTGLGEELRAPQETFGGYSMFDFLMMILLDIVLYGLLAAYFEMVYSCNADGWRRWGFFLLPSFWCPRKLTKEQMQSLIDKPAAYMKPVRDIEPPPNSKLGLESVRFVSLRKEFKSGEFVAVQGLTFDMYADEITCLLGHNGAGKTTAINMMTGILRPTFGTVLVNGMDVNFPPDLDRIRSSMGVCPQFDILYDFMTPREHLKMVGFMKGFKEPALSAAIDDMISELGLKRYANVLVQECSLGTKRKVSVAIALIFDPKVVFLDEPTSGMDPAARRHLWDVLKRHKVGKTILLTTHFMDEADILSDRKAIVSRGHLLCYGSSLFLKNRFGVGYSLKISLNKVHDVDSVTTLVQQTIPKARLVRKQRSEAVYVLPIENLNLFPALFESLEEREPDCDSPRISKLGVESFGISMTTLEDVFLKLASEGSEKIMQSDAPVQTILKEKLPPHADSVAAMEEKIAKRAEDPVQHGGPIGNSILDFRMVVESIEQMHFGQASFWTKFCALMAICLKNARRNVFSLISRSVLPIFMLIGGFTVLRITQEKAKAHQPIWSLYLDEGAVYIDRQCPIHLIEGIQRHRKTRWHFLKPDQSFKHADFLIQCENGSISAPWPGLEVKFNASAMHMIPYIINMLTDAVMAPALRGNLSLVNKAVEMQLQTDIKSVNIRPELTVSIDLIFAVILIGLGFALAGPSFAAEIVRFREKKISVLLGLNGVKFGQFWLSCFASHFFQCLPIVVLLPLLILAFGIKCFNTPGSLLVTFCLTFTFVPQSILFCYLLSRAFERAQTCMTALPPVMFILGFVPFLVPSVMMIVDHHDMAQLTHYVLCCVNPCYIIFGGLLYIARIHILLSVKMITPHYGYYWLWDNNVSFSIMMNCVHTFSLIAIAWILEQSGRSEYSEMDLPEAERLIDDEDKDVRRLREEIQSGKLETECGPTLVMKNVSKEYELSTAKRLGAALNKVICPQWQKPKTKVISGGKEIAVSTDSHQQALKNLYLATFPGEVFGLLGPSGAGKTTALKTVTGEEQLTAGQLTLCQTDISKRKRSRQNMVGYCPDLDALWDEVTLGEHLWFYTSINGLRKEQSQYIVNFLLDVLQIREHSNKYTKNLSGGTKRKLSFAIAILRSPKLVLLDEPSTGMDPQSKRLLWDAIMLSFRNERGAIMTTQSMEEAEYLCERVGILVNGELKCVGSTSHLTKIYGTGYYLEIRLAIGEDAKSNCKNGQASENVNNPVLANSQPEPQAVNNGVDFNLSHSKRDENRIRLLDFVELNFKHSELVESFSDNYIFHIPNYAAPKLSWSFGILEQVKNQEDPIIREYSLSQASLEQVFLHFAKEQNVEQQVESHWLKREQSKMTLSTRSTLALPETQTETVV